jgi:integrase
MKKTLLIFLLFLGQIFYAQAGSLHLTKFSFKASNVVPAMNDAIAEHALRIKQLSPENISFGIDGIKWIFKNRQKTDGPSNIPILPTAQEILDRYAENPKCINENRVLPILSNQKMNSYLKEIADVCGINKDLTFHAARHTFATTVTLSNGVPIESVSKMLGHKNLKSTQIYARVLDLKVSTDMIVLRNRLKEIMDSEDGKLLLSYSA